MEDHSHSFKYCDHFNVVYCQECGGEWKAESAAYTFSTTSATKPFIVNYTGSDTE